MNRKSYILISKVNLTGNRTAVFEYQDKTAFFYLLNTENNVGKQIIFATKIDTKFHDLKESNIEIRWNDRETEVNLYIQKQLKATFEIKQ